MKLKIDLDTENQKVIDKIEITVKYKDGTVDTNATPSISIQSMGSANVSKPAIQQPLEIETNMNSKPAGMFGDVF